MSVIIEHGVDPFYPREMGDLALSLAQQSSDWETVRILQQCRPVYSGAVVIASPGGVGELRYIELVPVVEQSRTDFWIFVRENYHAVETVNWKLRDLILNEANEEENTFSVKCSTEHVWNLQVIVTRKGDVRHLFENLRTSCGEEKSAFVATTERFYKKIDQFYREILVSGVFMVVVLLVCIALKL